MNKYYIRLLAGCAAFICYLSVNTATASSGNFYLELKGGVSKPGRLKGDMDHFTIKKSPVIEMAAGYNLNSNLAVGVSLAYHTKHKIELHSNREYSWGATNIYHKADVKTLVAMLNAQWNITEYNGFTPYAGLGVGVARHKFSGSNVYINRDLNKKVFIDDTSFFFKKVQGATNISFAWQLTAGLRKKITENAEVVFEYKYAKLGKIKNSRKSTKYNGAVSYEPIKKSTLGANNTFLLGIRYSF